MNELVIGILAGAIISWIIAHIYYKKSAAHIPDWAKSLIERLPEERPSPDRLLELFEDALQKGEIDPDPVFGHVACPVCKSPSKDFKKKVYSDENDRSVMIIECPHCGWSDSTDL
jgi:hypothetical protein